MSGDPEDDDHTFFIRMGGAEAAPLDYDSRPPLKCAWCTKPLRYPRRGPAPTYCGDACRKRHDRKAAAEAAAKSAGIVA